MKEKSNGNFINRFKTLGTLKQKASSILFVYFGKSHEFFTHIQEVLSQATEDHPTIILSDISAQDVRSIVEFSYHGEVRIPVDNISDLLEAAHSLKICGLMEVICLSVNL